ncbi:TatD family hydrolase [uncultured Sunxiuqinia sp.]|uniref:TatD family hydrolase n=1 Tax=uncultured Sunxiuqinia sp. TaxID=1573825 RepID=UPI002AA8CB2C|nr:TatD family hydrolase [uncultured Sunxiuqinia sp.]
MEFVNIHTHHHADVAGIQLVNYQIQFEFPERQEQNYSVGFHPWDIEVFDQDQMIEKLTKVAQYKNVFAIGECGLDRAIDTSLELQELVFIRQIALAEKFKKPLVIHAVKTYPDIIKIKKDRKVEIPWILHGYQGNLQTTKQLLNHNFHFSFGVRILRNEDKLVQSLKEIPLDRLFFETDESSEKIETIYIFAAQILEMNIRDLKETIWKNYQRIFEHGKVAR